MAPQPATNALSPFLLLLLVSLFFCPFVTSSPQANVTSPTDSPDSSLLVAAAIDSQSPNAPSVAPASEPASVSAPEQASTAAPEPAPETQSVPAPSSAAPPSSPQESTNTYPVIVAPVPAPSIPANNPEPAPAPAPQPTPAPAATAAPKSGASPSNDPSPVGDGGAKLKEDPGKSAPATATAAPASKVPASAKPTNRPGAAKDTNAPAGQDTNAPAGEDAHAPAGQDPNVPAGKHANDSARKDTDRAQSRSTDSTTTHSMPSDPACTVIYKGKTHIVEAQAAVTLAADSEDIPGTVETFIGAGSSVQARAGWAAGVAVAMAVAVTCGV